MPNTAGSEESRTGCGDEEFQDQRRRHEDWGTARDYNQNEIHLGVEQQRQMKTCGVILEGVHFLPQGGVDEDPSHDVLCRVEWHIVQDHTLCIHCCLREGW